jgi:hypothetical protein
MIKRSLVKHGNTWALVLDKTTREILGIDPSGPQGVEVSIQVKGSSIVVRKATDEK